MENIQTSQTHVQKDVDSLESHEAKKLARCIENVPYNARHCDLFYRRISSFHSDMSPQEKDALFTAVCSAALFHDSEQNCRHAVPFPELCKRARESSEQASNLLDIRLKRMLRSSTWEEFLHHFGKTVRYLEHISTVKPDADALYADLYEIRRYTVRSKTFSGWLEKIYG